MQCSVAGMYRSRVDLLSTPAMTEHHDDRLLSKRRKKRRRIKNPKNPPRQIIFMTQKGIRDSQYSPHLSGPLQRLHNYIRFQSFTE
jgi:hypothetical protein